LREVRIAVCRCVEMLHATQEWGRGDGSDKIGVCCSQVVLIYGVVVGIENCYFTNSRNGRNGNRSLQIWSLVERIDAGYAATNHTEIKLNYRALRCRSINAGNQDRASSKLRES